MIFQITDDLLDVESSAEQTGKRTQKDATRGKLTYPGFLGLEESRRHAQELGREAERHLAPLGAAGQRLVELVRYVLARDR
jgi:geranylgeranyl diphosphate synthase type II